MTTFDDKRIAELRAWIASDETLDESAYNGDQDRLAGDLKDLLDERERLRTALRWYADRDNYERGFRSSNSYAEEDNGQRAREALGEL